MDEKIKVRGVYDIHEMYVDTGIEPEPVGVFLIWPGYRQVLLRWDAWWHPDDHEAGGASVNLYSVHDLARLPFVSWKTFMEDLFWQLFIPDITLNPLINDYVARVSSLQRNVHGLILYSKEKE